jgi:hypothetical protein
MASQVFKSKGIKGLLCLVYSLTFIFSLGFNQSQAQTFTHPGMLHKQTDLDRMKSMVNLKIQPWTSGFAKLQANPHSAATIVAKPSSTVYRGTGSPENYGQFYNDIASAYANALRWHATGDLSHAEASIRILNAWSVSLKTIDGTSDKYLASGIYGYEIANAAELMRNYSGWAQKDFQRFQKMMLEVFYPMNHEFLLYHNGSCVSHYWANWDLCNMAAMLSIGILNDNRAIYLEAIEYFKHGAGNGAVQNTVWHIHPGNLGQWQESGRDQGHALMGPAVLGAFCEMAWNQGDDLYGYDDNRVLKGFEYVAKYNLGEDVPYLAYDNCSKANQQVISSTDRGGLRPGWELIYNHYVNLIGIEAPYSSQYAQKVRPEGGGGDYGPNSGGYDQLGYGTLTASLTKGPLPLFFTAPRKEGLKKEFGILFDIRGRRDIMRLVGMIEITKQGKEGPILTTR